MVKIVAHHHWGRRAVVIMAVAAFSIVCLLIALDAVQDGGMDSGIGRRAIVYGGLLGLVGTMTATILALRLFTALPAVVIDRHAILVPGWSEQPIPWTAIARLRQTSSHLQPLMELWLHLPDEFPPRSKPGRLLSRFNRRLGGSDLAIALWGLDIPAEELARRIEERWRQARRR